METESIGSSIGSSIATATAPSISSGFGFGGRAESFSFANTVSYNVPNISGFDGGGYNPRLNPLDTVFSTKADIGNISLDTKSGKDLCMTSMPQYVYDGMEDINLDPDILPNKPTFEILAGIEKNLEGINLDPGKPSYEIHEYYIKGLADINLDPSILPSEPTSGTLAGIEKSLEGVVLDPDLPKFENSETSVIDLAEPNLNLEPQTFLESINVIDLPFVETQSSIVEQINTSSEPEIAKIEAKSLELVADSLEQEKITQTSVIPSEVEDRAWESELALPELRQSIQTYNALINAGIQPEQAGILVEQALVKAGTEPKIAEKVAIKLKTQMSNVKTAAEISKLEEKDEKEEIEEEESADAEAMADKEEKKKKKKQLKFVVDEKALSVRMDDFKNALERTPVEIKDGREVIDGNNLVALMSTEVEKPKVKSEILPQYEIELFGFELGDGSRRAGVEAIRGMGIRSKDEYYQGGYSIIRNLPPVALAEDGKEVGKKDVERVFTFRPDPIRQLRKMIVYNN